MTMSMQSREDGSLEEALAVFRKLRSRWWETFQAAFTEYGPGAADETGQAGQWADLHRKVRKLKRALWEGDESYLTRESADEILHDIISHAFLALEMRQRGVPSGRVNPPPVRARPKRQYGRVVQGVDIQLNPASPTGLITGPLSGLPPLQS